MEQRYVLVTGASRGLGRRSAEELAGRGWTVVLACRDVADVASLLATVRGRGARAHAVPMDVTDPDSVAAAVDAVREVGGRLHALVNNAGVFRHAEERFPGLTPGDALDILLTNTYGPLVVTRAFLPLLRAAGGAAVVNVTSRDADEDTFDGEFTCYRASKAALNAMTRNLAVALRPDRIVVNAVDPGWIPTDMGGPEAPDSLDAAVTAVVDAVELAGSDRTGVLLRAGRDPAPPVAAPSEPNQRHQPDLPPPPVPRWSAS
ncbi:Short-chain dehydrogenase [Streptoalloteichus tenebrarius]|uniref:Putative apramycin biosynthesis oxidoreductase 3 n=1 Tax=Streptoalloteichus tenebrarius (strain ATCC 17920 / DSM 40477 / JCM 4838 / CBS 697.72 / NBRC 16177 / NCIMB 11028 / NRRL B-12390 / A12253. 1 / ISP 5477) TaxID=1933 RepID=Q2MFI9_STRSD|nr:SDR family NAD(P)-dependent oxidoreductase [Streptoalloteichus tenebrarius]MCP2261352.1 Short-chain dehydrogenase [Streptoalloteichus tenebrarius]CAF33052.1 putative apramycin biosynthesis oxidoreductase 3 [Streptoalloteichus tenebrarius]